MYVLTGVTKKYQTKRGPVAALNGVDLAIPDGEFLAIQGPTGHGKSTLLQMLGGLDRPTSGRVEFDGENLVDTSESRMTEMRARTFGFIFQTFNLVPTLSALENVEAALVPLRIPAPERRERCTAALAELGLEDRLHHLPSELSGGQQQRVAIARALVKQPKVVLADEPTGNLDEETRDEIIETIEELWRSRGLTLVVVTHDTSVARRAQRTAWLSKGKLKVRANSAAPPPAAGSPPVVAGN
jgi:putative ABC transport system ATP-binding protein